MNENIDKEKVLNDYPIVGYARELDKLKTQTIGNSAIVYVQENNEKEAMNNKTLQGESLKAIMESAKEAVKLLMETSHKATIEQARISLKLLEETRKSLKALKEQTESVNYKLVNELKTGDNSAPAKSFCSYLLNKSKLTQIALQDLTNDSTTRKNKRLANIIIFDTMLDNISTTPPKAQKIYLASLVKEYKERKAIHYIIEKIKQEYEIEHLDLIAPPLQELENMIKIYVDIMGDNSALVGTWEIKQTEDSIDIDLSQGIDHYLNTGLQALIADITRAVDLYVQ